MGVEFRAKRRARDRAARRRRRGRPRRARGEGRRVRRRAATPASATWPSSRTGRQLADPAPEVRAVSRPSCSSATTRCRFRRRRTSRGGSPTCAASTRTPSPRTAPTGRPLLQAGRTMLEIDVAGLARSRRSGSRSSARPRASASSRSPTTSCSARSSARTRSSPRTTPRVVGARPARPRPEGRRARAAALRPGRQLGRRRLALLAPARRRRAGQPLQRDRGVRSAQPTLAGYSNAVVEIFVGQARQGRVRLAPEPRARDLALRLAPRSGRAATPSSTGSPAASAPRRARCGSRTTSPARARRRG